MFWVVLVLACGLVGLVVVVAVGRRSYRQLRALVGELGHLAGDVDAVLAQLDPPDSSRAGSAPPRA